MTERFMMYSCLIHEEMNNGRKIGSIARKLGITTKLAEYLGACYTPEYEKYKACSLEELEHRKRKYRNMLIRLNIIKPKNVQFKEHVADSAFHMPISEPEKAEFNAIARRVFTDTYLPPSYRKPIGLPKIVNNRDDY